MVVSKEEACEYLRLDGDADAATVDIALAAAESLCVEVARSGEALNKQPELAKIAVLYAFAYLYEHRENADKGALKVDLRNLLSGTREVRF